MRFPSKIQMLLFGQFDINNYEIRRIPVRILVLRLISVNDAA